MKVMLKNTLGLTDDKGERVYVGPGEADVPDAYVEALGLEPVLEEMTAQEVLEAVDSGEVSKADALSAEQKRDRPRKTVTEGL